MRTKILKNGRPSVELARHINNMVTNAGVKGFFQFESGHLTKTKDVAKGDVIAWIQPNFSHHRRGASLIGYEAFYGEVVSESYGANSGQHTFTIEVYSLTDDRQKIGKIKRKGRTIYENAFLVERRATKEVLEEKHARGLSAKISALEGWLHDNPNPSIKRDRKVSELERFKGLQSAIDKHTRKIK
jgi:hypothetical protein